MLQRVFSCYSQRVLTHFDPQERSPNSWKWSVLVPKMHPKHAKKMVSLKLLLECLGFADNCFSAVLWLLSPYKGPNTVGNGLLWCQKCNENVSKISHLAEVAISKPRVLLSGGSATYLP